MTEELTWNDDSREDLRETLRSIILGEVRLAKSDRDDIIQTCREVYIEDECPEDEWETFIQYTVDEYERAATGHAAEKATWPPETDSDRLDRVEEELRNRGILLWQASPCCDTCSGSELPDRINEIEKRHPGFRGRVRGYAFFIDQSMAEMLAESTRLPVYLAYGWFSSDNSNVAHDEYEKNALGVANEICACLRENGFEIDWDGSFSKKIGVSLNWQRRKMLN